MKVVVGNEGRVGTRGGRVESENEGDERLNSGSSEMGGWSLMGGRLRVESGR